MFRVIAISLAMKDGSACRAHQHLNLDAQVWQQLIAEQGWHI